MNPETYFDQTKRTETKNVFFFVLFLQTKISLQSDSYNKAHGVVVEGGRGGGEDNVLKTAYITYPYV